MQNSQSDSLSISAVWISSYEFPTQKLLAPALTEIGKTVQKNFERWPTTCGDHYVNEITTGAKLFFSIRIEFASESEKNEFAAQFSISGPLGGVNASLEQASSQFSRHSKVFVDVLQVGGDVSKLTGVLNGSADTLQDCELGNFPKCAQTITNAVKYASDTTSGFPSQLAPGQVPGPVPLEYKTAPYTAIGIYPTNYPGLEESTLLARYEISTRFKKDYASDIQADRLLETKQPPARSALIANEKSKLEANLALLLAASAQASSQKVNGELAKFVDAYHQRKAQIRDISDIGVIEQACMDQVFQDWSKANLAMLDRTPNLDVNQIGPPLVDFGRAYIDSKRDTLSFEYVAAGINQAIRDERKLALSQHPIPTLNANAVSVDDWQEAAFLANTQLCLNRIVNNAIKEKVTIDFTAQIPPDITNYGQANLSWSASPHGGVDLIGVPADGPQSATAVVTGMIVGPGQVISGVVENRTFDLIPTPISLQNYLDLVHSN